MKTICVIGLGYIGLPTASLFANQGLRVYGVDSNRNVVDMINAGRNHIEEVGLRTLVEAAIGSGFLSASVEPCSADAFIIAVPTPIKDDKQPELSHVWEATRAIAPHLRDGNLVIVESTVPPGTTQRVADMISEIRRTKKGDASIHVAHCPERVLPGMILKELVENDRVVGGLTDEATELASRLYKNIASGTIYSTNATTAEMVKLSENTYRDVNISLANELAVICENLGINVWEVIRLANRHPRVNILRPGPGVGGHCIAVDPWFIVSEQPTEANVIRAARERNDSMPNRVIARVRSLLKGGNNKVALLGASYKGNVGDARNSPAVEIYLALRREMLEGDIVSINDMHTENTKLPLERLDEVLEGASLVVVLTDHDEYKELDPISVAAKVKDRVILDTRHCIDLERWKEAGFQTHLLGDGSNHT